jgi:hypothetical protein
MATYANTSSVPLSLAVFLATDNYDHNSETLSATALMKPVRQIILGNRLPEADASVDLIQMVASRMGTAIHDGIEQAWLHNYAVALKNLGYPDKIIDRVLINPEPKDLYEGCIPIYMEQRSTKKVGKYIISGKFDFVGEGRVEDFKTTSVFTAINHTNDDKYVLQLSIYRWLNPEIITQSDGAIQFIFTDWSAARARTEVKYPPQRIQQRILPLKSVAETERYVINKLALIEKHNDSAEADLPLCSDEDLWRSAPVFKYYKNPEKLARSTKNFDTKPEAYIRMAEEGGKGIVLEKPGQVMACKYCNAFALCSQKDDLIAAGDLVL